MAVGPAGAAGEDRWSVPDPLRETPPADRCCDVILNGGVASGVVYPWALLELARKYRFRRIGGNSVGAMAAALVAAAEYGRCHGHADAFEVLRRAPLDLAEEEGGRTLMQRLFQPAPGVRRLFECLLVAIRCFNPRQPLAHAGLLAARDLLGQYRLGRWLLAGALALLLPAIVRLQLPWVVGALVLLATAGFVARVATAAEDRRGLAFKHLLWALGIAHLLALPLAGPVPLLALAGWAVGVLAACAWLQVKPELEALRDNGYGLCAGRAPPDADGRIREKALVEWLHEGIQRSAGRLRTDAPLTFADLWSAPRFGQAMPPDRESISLEMFSTNITLSRPVSWPLRDTNARLFFRKEEWARFFPCTLLDAVWDAATPYEPASDSDPPATPAMLAYRQIPAGGMPIAVAARLSLSFPFLFSFIPVYAIDYELPRPERRLRQCQLTDGGLCTNFPIHLFDAAHPRWPTFGMMLSRRIAEHDQQSVWLPEQHLDGRADNWVRSVPGATGEAREPPLRGLRGLLAGMLGSALEWNDNLVSRLPHVRNRVLRMALRPNEGQLNILMSGETILRMAHAYGTRGGRLLARRFVSGDGQPTRAWQEHLYVRGMNQLQALRAHLRGYAGAVQSRAYGKPLAQILAEAKDKRPLHEKQGRPEDAPGSRLTPAQEAALQQAVQAVAELERSLEQLADQYGPYQPAPTTKLHLRSPI